jgi:hypothetical protein
MSFRHKPFPSFFIKVIKFEEWNNGILEYWNTGMMGYKKKPGFFSCNIPLFQFSKGFNDDKLTEKDNN